MPSTLTASAPAAAPAASPLVVPSVTNLHYAKRLTGGVTQQLASEIAAVGSARRWLTAQLDPATVSDAPGAEVDSWYALSWTPQQLFDRQMSSTQYAWQVMQDLSRWSSARRIRSQRQVQEQMVAFWSNLLHVPLLDDAAQFYRIDYDAQIRRNALGTFSDLLIAAVLHPAMSLYLDNALNSRTAPNENLGRELMELHTVGTEAGYTEADVKASARILTGYRVDVWYPAFQSFYDTSRHWTGQVKVLGFSHPNTSSDGQAVARAYLSYLARHPSTARRIARRLCLRFVSDNPSEGLIGTVAKAYSDNGTAIKPTLLAMVDHPEFLASAGGKIRTPMDDYVATVRALGPTISRPTSDSSFARSMLTQYRQLGEAPYEWPAPDGYPIEGSAWCSTGRVLTSFDVHRDVAGQYFPTKEVTYRTLTSWLPPLPATLDAVLDHVGIQLLGEKPRQTLKNSIASALTMTLDRSFTDKDAAGYWTIRTILISLLDSPQHLTR